METRAERAVELYKSCGYNCAQAVACTYSDVAGVDEKTIFRACEGFGHGMGCFEGTCGAVVGACVLAGFMLSTANLERPDSKAITVSASKQIVKSFIEQHGTIVCKELKGIGTGKPVCSCFDCIRDSALLAEKILFENQK